MGLFGKVFGSPVKDVADGVVEVAGKAADIVERWAPSDAKRHEMQIEVQKTIAQAVAEARQYDPRTLGTSLYAEVLNVTVDAFSRAIRPGVTILLLGAVFGWWTINVAVVDSKIADWAELVVGFWFGMRTLVKDIPALIQAVKK